MSQVVVCYSCGAGREVESQKPGEIKYKPCGACAEVGIRNLTDGVELGALPASRR